ncbi:sensor histidine kinase [Methanoregula sp. UBA64]|uniref:sensor histidine kinase n=1 Tax=Methanoregula sp. UBA64 TaxID=1915554 RepID=UPI0025DB3FD8|nr:HAMP domain-containing sensor histidine kinase [Methanoregula sp. UBA64]
MIRTPSNPPAWWLDISAQPRLLIFIALVTAGLILEIVLHLGYGISVVYTHFFYLIVVAAGVWFGKRAVWVALFFGGLHVAVSCLVAPGIPVDALLRATMLVIVAAVIGTVVDQMNAYYEQVLAKNRELTEMNSRLDTSQRAIVLANKKLNLLSSITRHDITNQLTALLAYIELSNMMATDDEMKRTIAKEETVAGNILRQIEFTKTYEDIGVKEPQWQNVAGLLSSLKPAIEGTGIALSAPPKSLEIYADPLLAKVFENLLDNSIRHGEHVRRIAVRYEMRGEACLLLYTDDGAGVPAKDKQRIFERGFGKHTGLGLFLTREILSITGITIAETGLYGGGVQFELCIPAGSFRC